MYDDALVFDCKQCGDCCVGFGGTYVNEEDIRAIADFMALPESEIRNRFCADSAGGRVLATGPEGRCVFQKDQVCSIHPVKPRMCREWPFIPAVLRQPGNWRLMGEACPGIHPEAPPEAVRACTLKSLCRTRPGFTWEKPTAPTDSPDNGVPHPHGKP